MACVFIFIDHMWFEWLFWNHFPHRKNIFSIKIERKPKKCNWDWDAI